MKILSINLWFDKYGHKTLAQLKSFSQFGYDTYAATIIDKDRALLCEIYRVKCAKEDETRRNATETGFEAYTIETIASEEIEKEAFGAAYFGAFRYIFDHACDNGFDIVYFRRLMSKIAFKALFDRI